MIIDNVKIYSKQLIRLALVAAALLLIGPAGADAQCVPYSDVGTCGDVEVALPYTLVWDGDEGGLDDSVGTGTGFTMVDPSSARQGVDGAATIPTVPGYEASRLTVTGGNLEIASNKGIQYKCNNPAGSDPLDSRCTCTPYGSGACTQPSSPPVNAQINALGVGMDLGGVIPIRISTTVVAPANAINTGSQQAGLWFGTDEENYIKFVVAYNTTSGTNRYKIQALKEAEGANLGATDEINSGNIIKATDVVVLAMTVDPGNTTVTFEYQINGGSAVAFGSYTLASAGVSIQPMFDGIDHDANGGTDPLSFAGIFTTYRNAASGSQTWQFDDFMVEEDVDCFVDGDCNDDVSCTTDVCEPNGTCSHTAIASSLCVNFQNPVGIVPTGYLRDSGDGFGNRTAADQGSGAYDYGWLRVDGDSVIETPFGMPPGEGGFTLTGVAEDMTAFGRDRGLNTDQRFDTLMHMQRDDLNPAETGPEAYWEIDLPNGVYTVKVAVGDPSAGADPERHRINVEGVNVIDNFYVAPALPANDPGRRTTGTIVVAVSDGTLTVDPTDLDNPAGFPGWNTKMDFIEIVPGGTVQCTIPNDCGAAGVCQEYACIAGNCVIGDSTAGTPCGDGSLNACTNPDTCDGAGSCEENHVIDGAPCGDQGVLCHVDDECLAGVCDDQGFVTPGSACGDQSDTECDNPNTCSPIGTCLINNEPNGTACMTDGNPCTLDQCNAGACANPAGNGGAVCRTSAGECDPQETCDGVSTTCPADAKDPNGSPCADEGNDCTLDQCNGTSNTCQHPNKTAGAACGDGNDTACTDPDTCDGAGACLDNDATDGSPCDDQGVDCRVDDTCQSGACQDSGFETAGTACGSVTDDACTDPDTCDGAGACDANNAANGSACGDQGIECVVDDACQSGACQDNGFVTAGAVCSDEPDICTDDSCDGAGMCAHIYDDTNDPSCTATTTTTTTSTTTTSLPVSGCGAAPATGCFASQRAQLALKGNADPSRNQLAWKWQRGEALLQSDLGDPATATTYYLCVYDQTAATPALVGTLQIDPNAAWQSKDPKGFNYKDKLGTEDGVQKGKLKTGAAGKSQAQVKAKGMNLPMPVAMGGGSYFDSDPSVVVQLLTSEGKCWTSEFPTASAKKNDDKQYKAKVK